jgi:hypothetical protein
MIWFRVYFYGIEQCPAIQFWLSNQIALRVWTGYVQDCSIVQLFHTIKLHFVSSNCDCGRLTFQY